MSKCKTCIYRTVISKMIKGQSEVGCYYICRTGEKRPCKPGDDCTVYVKGNPKSQRWNKDEL